MEYQVSHGIFSYVVIRGKSYCVFIHISSLEIVRKKVSEGIMHAVKSNVFVPALLVEFFTTFFQV